MFSKIRTRNTAACFLTFVALVFSLWLPATAQAQVAGATLSGTITDQSGAVIPQATISIKNIDTGITRTTTASTAGFYSVPNLLPGSYEVRTSAQGFSTEVKTGVTLTVGEQQVLDFTMQVGQTSQTVVVTTEAPNVELASSSIGALVNSTTVRELPLNGRSWTDLATLQPGVSAIQAQPDFAVGGDRGNRGFGNEVSVAGDRPEQNNYRLDGVSINDFNNAAPGSVLGGDLGVDAVQEFSVITSNVSAEYGRTSGGVINAITKSGTNQFHGSAYEFLRNDKLDAANFFENSNGLPKASFRQNQFGVSAGAPIMKDKLFIFGDYEGLRYSKGIPTSISVPSDNARLGILAGGTAANQPAGTPCTNGPAPGHYLSPLASVCVDDNAAKYLPFWPRAAVTPAGSDTGTFGFSAQRIVTENFFTIRGDYKISEKDSLFITYLRDATPYSSPDGLDAVLVSSNTNRHIVSLEETHTFGPTFVNSVRAGYNREYEINDVGATAINPLANDPTLGAITGQNAAHVLLGGIDQFTGGVLGNTTALYGWNSFQGYDDAFWTHGSHSIKFGGGVEREQLNRLTHTDPSGVFTFDTLTNFLTNNPHKFTGEDFSSVREQGLRQTIIGVYVQDDWRFRPNLTLNLGLRWEMATAINDNHGGIVNLVNMTDPAPLCGTFIPGCAGGGPLFANNTLHNFEPRLGFAWDPFHNGKTAVRGSFGMFDILPLAYQYIASATKQFPFVSSGAVNACQNPPKPPCLPQGSFYTGAVSQLTPKTAGSNNTEQYPHRSYVMQWNFNIQRELVKDLTLMVGYVGSRGVHEPFRVDDADIVLPTLTSAGYLYPQVDGSGNQCIANTQCASTTGNPPSRINEGFGSIGFLHYEGVSYYHALEAAVQKAMSHGVQFQTSFTWGKSMDTGSAAGHGDQFSNSISSLPFYDLGALRARSDFDITRTLVLSLTWDVPSPKSFSGPAAWVASGWELGSIFKVSDGIPFTPTWGTGGDPQGLLNSDDWAFPNRLSTPGCSTLTNPGNPNHYIKPECFTVPSAPNDAFWKANCDPAPPSLGYGFDELNPANPVPANNGNPPPAWLPPLACFNLRGSSGRNLLTGPGTTNLDFSVFKNQSIKRISESFKVQFRAEFFNVMNHANFGVPPIALLYTDIFDATGAPLSTGGVLTSTTTPGREIQFALKLNW
ncbi:MAG TPA: TonB-dependent receptor [Candidatus Acidoferrales bacterium]|nr:TonB-dependent receptor [Candidatus Acidoferrales bacterium]